MVKAAIGALLVLLILLAVVKLTDWLLVGVADLGQVQPSIAPADLAAHEQRPIGLAQGAEAVGNTRERADHTARLEGRSGSGESTFCLQCWQQKFASEAHPRDAS
jgi:hypothetical protein